MKAASPPFSRRRAAMTLIEVIAALSLMATLLTVVIVANSRHVRQLKLAERKRVGVEKLDQFLATWSFEDFRPSGVARAVDRCGMPASGYFGKVTGSKSRADDRSPYAVNVRKMGPGELGDSVRVRLTVSHQSDRDASGDGTSVDVAWAEILVPNS